MPCGTVKKKPSPQVQWPPYLKSPQQPLLGGQNHHPAHLLPSQTQAAPWRNEVPTFLRTPGCFRSMPRALHLWNPSVALLPLHLLIGPPDMNSALTHTWSLIHSPIHSFTVELLLWAPAPYHGGAVVIVFVIWLPGLEAAPAESMIAFGTGHAVEEASWSGFLPLARAPPGMPRAWTH